MLGLRGGRPPARLLPTVAAHRPASSRQASLCADPSLCRISPSWNQTSQAGWDRNGPQSGWAHCRAWVLFQTVLPLLRVGSPALARPVPSLGDMCVRQGPRPGPPHKHQGRPQSASVRTSDQRSLAFPRSNMLYVICERPLSVPLRITPCTDPQNHRPIQQSTGLLSEKERWLPASNARDVSRHLQEQLLLSVAMKTI